MSREKVAKATPKAKLHVELGANESFDAHRLLEE